MQVCNAIKTSLRCMHCHWKHIHILEYVCYLHDFRLNVYHTLKIWFWTCHIEPIENVTNPSHIKNVHNALSKMTIKVYWKFIILLCLSFPSTNPFARKERSPKTVHFCQYFCIVHHHIKCYKTDVFCMKEIELKMYLFVSRILMDFLYEWCVIMK